jgi:arylsulfatase
VLCTSLDACDLGSAVEVGEQGAKIVCKVTASLPGSGRLRLLEVGLVESFVTTWKRRTMAHAREKGARSVAEKPNILVIWGDDIGQSNLSCYTHGLMGYHTPNIDRIAKEGMLFTDSYGEQSCTAGRSSFLTGQSVYRTGMSKVGVPGSSVGLLDETVTLATLLNEEGYATGQFGKNHLGDLNRFLPTIHGFDEFFGNLYHLNAEEDPEQYDYPPAEDFPHFREMFGPRGVIRSWATDEDDPTEQPRWGRSASKKSRTRAR